MEDLKKAKECGVEVVRIAVHCTEIDVAMQHIKLAKELGMDADEVLRLKQITGLAELFKDENFSLAWE